MAAGSHTFMLSNGQKLEVTHNSSIVGAPLHCSMTGAATATSPYTFTVQAQCSVIDFWVVTSTAGDIEIFANGQPTGKKYQLSQRYLITLANRRDFIPQFTFRPGVQYSLIPRVAIS